MENSLCGLVLLSGPLGCRWMQANSRKNTHTRRDRTLSRPTLCVLLQLSRRAHWDIILRTHTQCREKTKRIYLRRGGSDLHEESSCTRELMGARISIFNASHRAQCNHKVHAHSPKSARRQTSMEKSARSCSQWSRIMSASAGRN
jgi:hypothetical protein